MSEIPDRSETEARAEDRPESVVPAAGLGVRAVARLIDYVPLAVVTGIVLSVLPDALGALVGAAVNLAYFAVLESRGGQTLGKTVMKLRTVDSSGRVPSFEQAVRRNIWVAFGVVGVIPFVGAPLGGAAQLIAVVMIAVGIADGAGGGGWHDRFAGGTRVVRADR